MKGLEQKKCDLQTDRHTYRQTDIRTKWFIEELRS